VLHRARVNLNCHRGLDATIAVLVADLVLKRGRVVTPGGTISGGLAIEGGVIVAIEDMTTETVPAAIGGVTTIVTDHENANCDSWVTTRIERGGEPLLARAKRELEARSPIDVRFTANPCTDADLDEIASLVSSGVSSFKMFPSYIGEEAAEFGITTVEYAFIFRAFERIAAAERPDRPTQGMVHCEEPTIGAMLKERYRLEGHESLECPRGRTSRQRPCRCRLRRDSPAAQRRWWRAQRALHPLGAHPGAVVRAARRSA
jgi:dihydroorotase-like cyclic amidohydrolase